MTDKEIAAVVWNVLKLEGLATEISKLPAKELRAAIARTRSIVEGMPTGALERELAYKQIEFVVRDVFELPARQLTVDLQAALPPEAAAQVTWAAKYIDAVPPAINETTRAALEAVGDVRILNKGVSEIAQPLARSQWRRVNKVVRAGFLEGKTNSQIAKDIGATYKASKAEIRAIARTAVMATAQESHDQFWDANSEVIEGWIYDASFDFRVCPICAPLHGTKAKTRPELVEKTGLPPIHPNCRCMIIPLTGIDTATGERSYVELSKDKPAEGDGVRVFKQKVRGEDGEMYWKVAREMPADSTMGDFINRATISTQDNILGVKRAARFRKLIRGGTSPQSALVKVTKSSAPAPAPAPRPRPAPKPAPTPTPATVAAQKAEEKALAKLSTQMGSAELDEILRATNRKVVSKTKLPDVADVRGINPVRLFHDSKDSLGRGAFGEARLTDRGVVKRGWLSKSEISITETLNDTGVTPRLLGSAYEGDWKPKLFPGMNVRRGYMLLEKAPGDSMQKLISYGGGLTDKQANSAFESLMQARKKIHLKGVAHQDMHPGNLLFDTKSDKLTVIDFGLARKDSRAALVEALGVMQSPIGVVGDFQSKTLLTYLNKTGGVKKSEMWKQFKRNRKSVIEKLEAEGAGTLVNWSIRQPLPKVVTTNLSTQRALELLKELYEGI